MSITCLTTMGESSAALLKDVTALLNTSSRFQEPNVCPPEGGVNTFLATDVDYLVMENQLVPRPVG